MTNITLEEVSALLEEMYLDGKVSKSMKNGEVYYSHIPEDKNPTIPPKPEFPSSGNSYNLLKRFDPPIPPQMMNWRGEVYEVTGVKDGGRIVSKFFKLDQKEKAAEYLLSLDQGHVWLSQATDYVDPDFGMFTGKRKRVHLLSPDAIFRK